MAVDLLGRDLGQMIVDEIMPALNSAFGPAQKMDPNKGGGESDKHKHFEKFAAKLDKQIKGINRELKDAHKTTTEIKKSSKKKERPSVAEATSSKKLNSIEKDIHNFAEAATKKGSIFVHDQGLHDRVDALIANAAKGMGGAPTTAAAIGAGGYGGGPPGSTTAAAGGAPGGGAQHTGSFLSAGLRDFKPMWSAIAGQIGGGMEYWQHLLGGAIDKELEFRQELNKIAFQTQGITSETRGLQEAWYDVGKVAEQTGQNVTTFQENYVQLLKRGVQSQKQAQNITKTSLQLAKMLDVKSEGVASTFMEWNMTLDLNTDQMADISRGVQDIAKWTGVTGDRLMNVVKSSEQFLRRMKAAGSVTATAAKNVIMMMAEAEKMGIGNEMQEIMGGMSNNADLLLRSSKETKRLLFMAAGSTGRVRDLMQGTLLNTKGGLKDMAMGMENVFKRFSGGISSKDVDKMSAEQKSVLNLRLEAAGMGGLEDFVKKIKVTENSAMTYAERLADIDKEMKKNLSTEERKALVLKQQNMLMNFGLEQSTKLAEALKVDGVKTIDQAFDQMHKQAGAGWGDMMKDLQASGMLKEGASKKDTVMAMGMAAAEGIKKAGGTDFTGQMRAAINSSDMTGILDLQEKMTAEQQKLGIKENAKRDPISQVAQYTKEINEYLRSFMGPGLWKLVTVLGPGGLLLLNLASMVGATEMGQKMMGGLFGKLSGLFGKGTGLGGFFGKGAGAASEAAGSIPGVAAGAGEAASAAMTGGAEALSGADKAGGMLGKINLGSLMKLAPKMALGAAVLLVLTPAIILLAGALIKISKAVMSFMGIDAKTATETAKAVGSLIISAGIIALAVVGMAAVATALGALVMLASGPQLLLILGAMAYGAIALMALAPAMIALAAAVVHISNATMKVLGINPAKAAETASAVSSLMWSAAQIALAVLVSAGALTALGLMAPLAFTIVPFMLLGAGALLVMAPGMIALAAAVVLVSQAAMSAIGMDPAKAAETASAVASLLESAGKIATTVLVSVAVLTALGALALMASFIVPLMFLGAGALMVLTPAIVSMAGAIIHITQESMKTVGTDPKAAAETAQNVASVIDSAGDIAQKILTTSAKLSFIGQFALLAPFIALSMMAATGAFLLISGALFEYVKSIVYVGQALTSINKHGEIEEINKSLTSVFQLTDVLAKNIVGFTDKVDPLMDKGWFGFASSPLEKVFSGLARLLKKGIIDPVKDEFPDRAEMEAAWKSIDIVRASLEDFVKIIDAIDKITQQLAQKKFENMDAMVANINKATASMSKIDMKSIEEAGNKLKYAVPLADPSNANFGGINSWTEPQNMTAQMKQAQEAAAAQATTEQGKASVNPMPLYNVHDWVEKKRSGLQESNKNTEMLSIDQSARRQVQLQTEMLEALYMLVDAFSSPKTVGNSAAQRYASTTPNISPSNSPDYNNWSQSNYGSNANIALAPTGV